MTKEIKTKSTESQNENGNSVHPYLDSDQDMEIEKPETTGVESEQISTSNDEKLEEQDVSSDEDETEAKEPTSEERAKQAEDKYGEMQDRYLRLNAEFENYKKRMMRENSDRLKYFNMEIIKELLPSLDNLERAMSHAEEAKSDPENMLEGLQMVYKGMQEAFGKFGVVKIDSFGKEFDPNCHQAVGMIESNEVPENHVAEECLTGYYLHDRIIRPTMVRVSGKG